MAQATLIKVLAQRDATLTERISLVFAVHLTRYTPVASLAEGVNGGKASRVTVVQVIGDDKLPRTFLAVDAEATFVCLTVYNVKEDAIRCVGV